MGMPASVEARRYYRCAIQRYDDADVLRKAEHTTGCVYLAGYGIECILKALLLESVPAGRRPAILRSFRERGHGHDYDWIRASYFENGGARFPSEISRQFVLVNEWSTELRYDSRILKLNEAEQFLNAARAIIKWAQGRM